MKGAGALLMLASALGGCAPLAAAEDLAGDWRVNDVYCGTCNTVNRSQVGKLLHLSATEVSDDLGGGRCPGAVSQREMEKDSPQRLGIESKLSPKWRSPGATGDLKVVVVTCDKLDFIVLVKLSKDELVYLSEGDLTYRLKRSTNRAAVTSR